jgi:hypothetical protein
MQNYNLQKNPIKETKILQIISLQLISSFNTSQNIIFQKSSYKIVLLPVSTILNNEFKHNIHAYQGKANKVNTIEWGGPIVPQVYQILEFTAMLTRPSKPKVRWPQWQWCEVQGIKLQISK